MKVVDMHCDTIAELYYAKLDGRPVSILESTLHIDLKKMQKGDYLLQNFALYTNLAKVEHPFEYAMQLADLFFTELEAYPDLIGIVKSWQDIEANRKTGRMSALLTIEEGGVCQGNLAYLRDFYRLGVRMMTLTWNHSNDLAYPNNMKERIPDTMNGLTETGIEFVREMERLGMIIDVSHLGDAGIWDVFRYTAKPFVASHSNARALNGHPRNLTDDMIRALAERGGVAGINFYAPLLQKAEPDQELTHSYCRDMAAHMIHMKQVGGIDCIGLGTDFDGIESIVEMKDCSGIQMLADEMVRQGFVTSEIEAVFYKNVLRIYQELL